MFNRARYNAMQRLRSATRQLQHQHPIAPFPMARNFHPTAISPQSLSHNFSLNRHFSTEDKASHLEVYGPEISLEKYSTNYFFTDHQRRTIEQFCKMHGYAWVHYQQGGTEHIKNGRKFVGYELATLGRVGRLEIIVYSWSFEKDCPGIVVMDPHEEESHGPINIELMRDLNQLRVMLGQAPKK